MASRTCDGDGRGVLRHICVAYDDTPEGDAALAEAWALARRDGARVTIVHVAPPVDDVAGEHEELHLELLAGREDVRRRQRLVAEAARRMPDVDTDVRVLYGSPAEQLLAFLHAERPDVAIVGVDGGRASRRLGRRLVARARCPVLLVRPGSDAGRTATGGQGPIVGAADLDTATDPVPASHLLTDSAPDEAHVARAARPPAGGSLLWQLFIADALVLVVAVVILVVTPVRVSTEVVLSEVVVLLAGVAVVLAANFLLLRRALAPLRLLTDMIATIEARRPGRRLPVAETRTVEVASLATAFNAMLDRLEAERRDSARRALAAQEDERLRIARELHDELGQTLTALTIQAERAAEEPGPASREDLERLASTALKSLDDVRRIGRELRPEALDDLGLGNALIALCRRTAEGGGVRVTHRLSSDVPALRPEVELVVYRIAQEALTNALRHAGATRLEVALDVTAQGVELTVTDDGRGLPEELPEDTAGVGGMRERALLVGGRLSLRSHEGGGTEVHLVVPLAEAVAEA
jgi:two-component system sensor histidine kinase UhpB